MDAINICLESSRSFRACFQPLIINASIWAPFLLVTPQLYLEAEGSKPASQRPDAEEAWPRRFPHLWERSEYKELLPGGPRVQSRNGDRCSAAAGSAGEGFCSLLLPGSELSPLGSLPHHRPPAPSLPLISFFLKGLNFFSALFLIKNKYRCYNLQ